MLPDNAGFVRVGVVSVGLVSNTTSPVPAPVTISFSAVELGFVKKVSTSVPRLEMPATGSPVALVNTSALGVPNAGVTIVLFVSISDPARVASVPVVGSVTFVVPVVVRVWE